METEIKKIFFQRIEEIKSFNTLDKHIIKEAFNNAELQLIINNLTTMTNV